MQKQLDDINAANLSDLEKAQKAAKDAEDAAHKATAEALRLRVAAKHGIDWAARKRSAVTAALRWGPDDG